MKTKAISLIKDLILILAVSVIAYSHWTAMERSAANAERTNMVYEDFYGKCDQCHDGVLAGMTLEEQEKILYKILRGE
jgi:hypothetical protein